MRQFDRYYPVLRIELEIFHLADCFDTSRGEQKSEGQFFDISRGDGRTMLLAMQEPQFD
jgi:hypothetical protein